MEADLSTSFFLILSVYFAEGSVERLELVSQVSFLEVPGHHLDHHGDFRLTRLGIVPTKKQSPSLDAFTGSRSFDNRDALAFAHRGDAGTPLLPGRGLRGTTLQPCSLRQNSIWLNPSANRLHLCALHQRKTRTTRRTLSSPLAVRRTGDLFDTRASLSPPEQRCGFCVCLYSACWCCTGLRCCSQDCLSYGCVSLRCSAVAGYLSSWLASGSWDASGLQMHD